MLAVLNAGENCLLRQNIRVYDVPMTKPKIGDIIEIKTRCGYAYALYTHEHKMFGSLLRVFGLVNSSRPNSFDDLIAREPQFETFFPLAAALARGVVSAAGRVEIPLRLRRFPVFRDGVADPKTGKVPNWWLWDGEKEWLIGNLSEEQAKYP